MKIKEKSIKTVIRNDLVNADGIEYRYKLLMSKSKKVASYSLPLYSIEIDMRAKDGETTECSVENVFSDVGKAIVFYERMIKNLATPIDLPYILEDEIYN